MPRAQRSKDPLLYPDSSETFLGNRLPSRKELLSVFLFHHVDKKEFVSAAAGFTTIKILDVWKKANIPTSNPSYIKNKVMKFFSDLKTFKKLKNRTTETEVAKRGIFKDSLDVFNVAHTDALASGIPEEDKDFLRSQRDDRTTSSMGGTEQTSMKKQERGRLKREREDERRERRP